MLAVHWTPVNQTKKILKNGIRKSQRGLYCFPLTGHRHLDKWWVNFFNQCGARDRKEYNGIIFRIASEDLPAYWGHWIGATNRDVFKKEITDLKTLSKQFREVLLWRMGEAIAGADNLAKGINDYKVINDLYLELADKELKKGNRAFTERLNSLDFMSYALEDYQIVLSHSIPAARIIKVIPQRNESGRVLKQQKSSAGKAGHGEQD